MISSDDVINTQTTGRFGEVAVIEMRQRSCTDASGTNWVKKDTRWNMEIRFGTRRRSTSRDIIFIDCSHGR